MNIYMSEGMKKKITVSRIVESPLITAVLQQQLQIGDPAEGEGAGERCRRESSGGDGELTCHSGAPTGPWSCPRSPAKPPGHSSEPLPAEAVHTCMPTAQRQRERERERAITEYNTAHSAI